MALRKACGKKILHLINDEKFPDYAISSFEEAYPKGNDYLCIGEKESLEHLKSDLVEQLPRKSILTTDFIKRLKSYEAIVFHSFASPYYHLIALLVPLRTKKLWIGWGYDYYDLICKKEELLKPNTLDLSRANTPVVVHANILQVAKRGIKKPIIPLIRRQGIKRIDYFSPVIFEDYKLVTSRNPWIKAKYVAWNYGVTGKMNWQEGLTGDNILIGNSASYTNNHIEIFKTLAECDLADRKVICPLNYGDMQYAEHIIKLGKRLFGKAFTPLTEFMDLTEYAKVVSSCSLVFMNHLRQQAGGNINMALIFGAKVFLDTASPFFRHYSDLGIKVFPIHDLCQASLTRLPSEVAQKNASILKETASRDVIIAKTKDVVKRLLEPS